MAEYLIQEQTLIKLADAIRSKTGKTGAFTIDDMTSNILELNSSGTGSEIAEPYVVYTYDDEKHITGVALYNFKIIPSYMFYNKSTSSGSFIHLKTVDFSGSPELEAILDYAFYCCVNLELTSLPDSINYIGASAFYKCSGISLSVIPESIYSIGDSAFGYCTGITHIELRCTHLATATRNVSSNGAVSYVVTGGKRIFANCTNLESVWIRDTCNNISASSTSYSPFMACSALTTIYAEDAYKESGWGEYFAYNTTSASVPVVYGQTTCPW